MSELTIGNIHGMLTNADFYLRLNLMTSLAEQDQGLSAFVVRRAGEHPNDPKLDYSFLIPLNEGGSNKPLEEEIAQGRLGALVTSTSCDGLEYPINAIAPLPAELERSVELGQTNPGIVHGITAFEPFFGGMSLLLYRQSPNRVLIPSLLDNMPTERNLRAAREVMHCAGFNSVVLRYSSRKYVIGQQNDIGLFH